MELPEKYFWEKNPNRIVEPADKIKAPFWEYTPWNLSVEHCSLLISDKLNSLECSVWRHDHSVDSNWLTQAYMVL